MIYLYYNLFYFNLSFSLLVELYYIILYSIHASIVNGNVILCEFSLMLDVTDILAFYWTTEAINGDQHFSV